MENKENNSEIDKIFEDIFGFKPNKDGASYEMLCAAVLKIIDPSQDVYFDTKITPKFSKYKYQIDVSIKESDNTNVGEAKDYTIRKAKVGRSDIQKLGGTLNDLESKKGLFFSATGYTKPAQSYAEHSIEINKKPIELFTLRPFIETDKDGRILGVNFEGSYHYLDFENGYYEIIFTEQSKAIIKEYCTKRNLKEFNYNVSLEKIFDSKGDTKYTLYNLTWNLSKKLRYDMDLMHGCFITKDGYINIDNYFYSIEGIEFKIDAKIFVDKFTITVEDKCKLLIKSESGKIDKIITEDELKSVIFGDNNQIKLKKEDSKISNIKKGIGYQFIYHFESEKEKEYFINQEKLIDFGFFTSNNKVPFFDSHGNITYHDIQDKINTKIKNLKILERDNNIISLNFEENDTYLKILPSNFLTKVIGIKIKYE